MLKEKLSYCWKRVTGAGTRYSLMYSNGADIKWLQIDPINGVKDLYTIDLRRLDSNTARDATPFFKCLEGPRWYAETERYKNRLTGQSSFTQKEAQRIVTTITEDWEKDSFMVCRKQLFSGRIIPPSHPEVN